MGNPASEETGIAATQNAAPVHAFTCANCGKGGDVMPIMRAGMERGRPIVVACSPECMAALRLPTVLSLIAELREARALMREAAERLQEHAEENFPGHYLDPVEDRKFRKATDIVRLLLDAAGDGE